MLIGLFALLAHADPSSATLPECGLSDEPALYVLTVQPRQDIINLFGHSALLAWEPEHGEFSPLYDYGRFRLPPSVVDTVVNYLTMQQTYYVASSPMSRSEARYRRQGRGVIAQRLSLSRDESERLQAAVRREASTNPEFRYNWYHTNCSTKLRDRIDEVLDGALQEQMQGPSGTSPAAEVLRHSAGHPLWLGLQWGSTRFARQEITDWDAMFLPEPLMTRLARAKRSDGSPLVAETCQLVPVGQEAILTKPPSRWFGLTLLGLAIGAAMVGVSRTSRTAGLVGIGLWSMGLATWGTAALTVGLAGTFAPFWGHDNLAFASPLWFAGVIAAVGAWSRAEARWPAMIGVGLLAAAVLGVLGSLLFGFAAGNLGLAGVLVPPAAAVAWGLGVDRFVPDERFTAWRPGAASRVPTAD